MTEQEWLKATESFRLEQFVEKKAGPRKLRLYACACCDAICDYITHSDSIHAVEAAREFADGGISKEKLKNAHQAAKQVKERDNDNRARAAASAAAYAAYPPAKSAARISANAALSVQTFLSRNDCRPGSIAHCQLLRDIFSPFYSVRMERAWATDDVLQLARAIYDTNDFDRLGELVPLLKRNGCDAEPLLAHLASSGPHVRGCWALDVVLGNKDACKPQAGKPAAKKQPKAKPRSLPPPSGLILRDPATPVADLKDTWRRLEAWFAANRYHVDQGLALQSGGNTKQFEACERAFGQKLPADVKASYRIHDGQLESPEDTFLLGFSMLSLGRAVEEWQSWLKLAGSDDEVDEREKSFPVGAVKRSYFRTGWIPLAANGGGSHIGVDLDPDGHGTRGQVIIFGRDYSVKYVLARSWAQFLEDIACELEAGNELEDVSLPDWTRAKLGLSSLGAADAELWDALQR